MSENYFHRWAQLCTGAAFFVIFAGAMVTSTGSGMAVPDWPLSFGMWMPKMVGGVFFEHGHRMAAGTAGAMTLALAVWAAAVEKRRAVRFTAYAALLAVALQAGLGGLTVLIGTWKESAETSPLVSTAHACLAQVFFGLLLSMAAMTSPGWRRRERRAEVPGSWRRMAAWALAAAYLQIILGAVMRHQKAGLAIPDFPLSYGRLVPEFNDYRVALNFAHRSFAWIVAGLCLAASIKVLSGSARPWLRLPAWILLGAVLAQLALGAATVWSLKNPVVASLHVLGGAMVLGSSLVLALRLWRPKEPARA